MIPTLLKTRFRSTLSTIKVHVATNALNRGWSDQQPVQIFGRLLIALIRYRVCVVNCVRHQHLLRGGGGYIEVGGGGWSMRRGGRQDGLEGISADWLAGWLVGWLKKK